MAPFVAVLRNPHDFLPLLLTLHDAGRFLSQVLLRLMRPGESVEPTAFPLLEPLLEVIGHSLVHALRVVFNVAVLEYNFSYRLRRWPLEQVS
jgi:hypothetical protein